MAKPVHKNTKSIRVMVTPEILEWYDKLPHGKRQEIVRDLLIQGLGNSGSFEFIKVETTEAVAQHTLEIHALADRIEYLESVMGVALRSLSDLKDSVEAQECTCQKKGG